MHRHFTAYVILKGLQGPLKIVFKIASTTLGEYGVWHGNSIPSLFSLVQKQLKWFPWNDCSMELALSVAGPAIPDQPKTFHPDRSDLQVPKPTQELQPTLYIQLATSLLKLPPYSNVLVSVYFSSHISGEMRKPWLFQSPRCFTDYSLKSLWHKNVSLHYLSHFSYTTLQNFEPSFQAWMWVLQVLPSLNAAKMSSLYASYWPLGHALLLFPPLECTWCHD